MKRTPVAAVVGVTLVALALRLFRIDAQGAWFDEAFTIHAAAGGWDEMMRILVLDFNHPPLHTMLVRWWFDLFGVGVVQARILSTIFGTAAVPALYWLGVLLFDRRTALVAAFLLAISQLGIIYSQEARAYSLLLLLVIAASGFFVRAFRSPSRRDFALFVATASVLLYTHYYSVFPLISLVILAVVFRRHSRIPAAWWAAALGVVVVAYLPWLTSGVVESALRNPQGAVVEGLGAQLASPLYAVNWFNNGKIAGVRNPAPLWAFLAGLVLFTGPAVYALARLVRGSDREQRAVALIVLTSVVPVLAVWSFGLLHVVYDVRHVSFAVAPYYLLVARGHTLASSAALRRLLIGATVGYTALSFRADYYVPYKENFREAVEIIAIQSRAGDCTVFDAPDGNSVADLYWDAHRHGQAPPTLIRRDEASARADCLRIWLVWDRSFWKTGPMTYEVAKETIGRAYRPGARWSLVGVDLQLFERRPN